MSDENDFVISKNGVIEKYTGAETAIEIPKTIRGITVRTIGERVFFGKGLISVFIPESVTQISNWAFANNQLVNIAISSSETHTIVSVFHKQLVNSLVSNTVMKISEGEFSNNRLTDIVLPRSVKVIAYQAFANNPLRSIIISGKISLPRKKQKSAFDNGFDDFYKNNKKKSETYYLFDGKNWSIKE